MAAPASYSRRSYVGNAAATTVPLGLGASDGSCALASATNWPSGSGGDFLVVIDRGLNTEELAWGSATSGTTLTFAARGAQGTTGVAHAAGCTIALSFGQQDLDESNQVVNQVLGQASAAKGDILAMLSAAGPNTLTRVPIGTSGQLLGVAAGLPAWQYPVLTLLSGNIPSQVNLGVNTPTSIFSTASLSVGTWLVTMGWHGSSNAGGAIECHAAVNTATATLTGELSSGADTTNVNLAVDGSITFSAVVTVAGTLQLIGEGSAASATVIDAVTRAFGFANATGYTALRVA